MRYLVLLWLGLTFGCASARTQPETTLRVLVYNIHAGRDAGGVDNLERVASIIKTTRADLVLLQEVDRGTRRSGNVDQLAILMRLTQLHGAFGKSLDYQGGDYGIAVLSRWPITAQETVSLPVQPQQTRAGGSYEPRIALYVVTATPNGALGVMNTHIDPSAEDVYRRQEVAHVISAAKRLRPLLVGGDFNDTPGSAVYKTLREAGLHDPWRECGEGPELTYPAIAPVKRIDYLFLNGDAARCTSAKVLDSTASDHRAVLLNLAMR